jgi:hypothetical protein
LKRPHLPSGEVIIGNCGGYLSTGGHDEFMLGSGFGQSTEFVEEARRNLEAQSCHYDPKRSPQAMKMCHI